MEIYERFKKARKKLGLTQTEVGDIIGMKQGGIGNIEQGRTNLTDRNILLFCNSFNVNPEWLRNGGSDEEMFCEIPDNSLIDFANDHGLDKDSQFFLLAFAKMDEQKRGVFLSTLKELIQDEESPPPTEEVEKEKPVGYVWEDFDVEEETEKFRQQLLEEKRAKAKSSVSDKQSLA